MGKYNFNYDKIQELTAKNQQLNAENENLKTNLEGLTKAMEALAKEVLELKTGRKKQKVGFSAYISDTVTERLFRVKAVDENVIAKADDYITKGNITTFYANIVRAISPVGRKTNNKPFLSGKPISDMTEDEKRIIGEAIKACAEICYNAKMKLEEIK